MPHLPRTLLSLLFALVTAPVSAALPASAAGSAPPHESLRLRSASLQEERRINVYLPPHYDRCEAARFPVLYMPDGGLAEDFPHVATAVDRLIREGALRPMLVVGVENTDRRRDVTGPTQAPEDLEVTRAPGGSPRFREFFARELQPVVQARYRVSGDKAVIGESLAGLFIVETLFVQPTLFDTYIALDPSLWWNGSQWIREAPARLPALRVPGRRLFLAAGGAESNRDVVEPFAAALEAHASPALQWEYQPHAELQHATIYRALAAPVLTALYPPAPGSAADPCPAAQRDDAAAPGAGP